MEDERGMELIDFLLNFFGPILAPAGVLVQGIINLIQMLLALVFGFVGVPI